MSHASYLQRVTNFFARDYVDRGMLKWQGFFLSDHTAALKKQATTEHAAIPALPVQAQADIRAALARAFATGQRVRVQLKSVTEDGTLTPPFDGAVVGYTANDGVSLDARTVAIADLRNVTVLPFKIS